MQWAIPKMEIERSTNSTPILGSVMTVKETARFLRGEYLSNFMFFDPEAMTWTKDLNEAICLTTHSIVECNAG